MRERKNQQRTSRSGVRPADGLEKRSKGFKSEELGGGMSFQPAQEERSTVQVTDDCDLGAVAFFAACLRSGYSSSNCSTAIVGGRLSMSCR